MFICISEFLYKNYFSYERSHSGWNKEFKIEELFDENAYYLIIYKDITPVGYSHFRFDMDFDNEVVYWYCQGIKLNFFFNFLIY